MRGPAAAYGGRYRSMLVVAVVTTVLGVGGAFVIGVAIGTASFAQVERNFALEDAARVEAAYESEVAYLERVTGDWAAWDDTYAFVAGENPEYAADNLAPDTLANLGVTDMVFFDADGELIQAVCVDPVCAELRNGPAEMFGLGRDDLVAAPLPLGEVRSGLVMTSSGPLVFAARPVTDSEGTAPPLGVLLVGRMFDATMAEDLADVTRLAVSIGEVADGSPPVGSITISDEGPSALFVTQTLGAVDGSPAIVLTTRASREVQTEGVRAVTVFGVLLGIIALTLLAILLFALRQERRVFRELARADEENARVQDRYRSLIDSMADAVVGVQNDGVVFFANPRAARLLSREVPQIVGLHYEALMSPDSARLVGDNLSREHGSIDTWELTLLSALGETIPVEARVSWFAESADDAGRMQWIMRDVAERRRFERELVHLATHDHLTGLYNRLRFEEEFETRLAQARRAERPTALLWIDLDNFKQVNDSLGHGAGDELLVNLALGLGERLRQDSTLARLGGDEFGILMPDVPRGEIAAVANRVLEDIRTMEFVTEGSCVRMSPSIGVVVLPDHATTPSEALARADLAMYRAKADGGNQVCIYEPAADWQAELKLRFDWSLAIESALRENRMVVHWQPILDLTTDTVDRYELLVRLQQQDGTLVPPGVFLPVAEQLGLIREIDAYMVRYAVGLLASLPDSDIRVDVNLSARALSDTSLPELVAHELVARGVEPARLGVEITETVAVVDMAKARMFIEGLKSAGVRVTLDDFGSGFSSFYYLRHLPIDALKIDGSFVRDLTESQRDQHVVRSIVQLAAGLGIDVTAECVESAESLEMLRGFGVRFAQGFHVARPGPVDAASHGRSSESPAGQ